MNRKVISEFLLLSLLLLLWAMFRVPSVNADPLNVCWYVTNATGDPLDGAHLTIYWSTSLSGPFNPMASSIVEDKIAGVYQNPIVTGYWNPDHPHGIALGDLHITGVSKYYFYVEITYGSEVWYWPVATSTKPGSSDWFTLYVKQTTASPSGYVVTGNGFGNGPTTAYPTQGPPPQVIPEVPMGPIMAVASMMTAFVAYSGLRRRKIRSAS